MLFIHRILFRINQNPDYWGAVFTGYALTAFNILIQVVLVPLYLEKLGKYQFGILMIFLSFINYAAIGIGWMSGGMLRILGEYAATNDDIGFAQSYRLSKLIYLAYAWCISLGIIAFGLGSGTFFLKNIPPQYVNTVQLTSISSAIYFVLLYDLSVERLALVAKQKQVAGNLLQILSLLVFVVTVIPWLLYGGGLEGIFVCLLSGVVIARTLSWIYWKKLNIKFQGKWLSPENWLLLKRLMGPMGLGYLLYGVILLTMQADIMLIGWLGGATMAAEFVLVWKIADVLIQIIWRIPETYQPYLIQMDARGEQDKLKENYQRGLRWLTLLSLAVGGLYGLFGSGLVKIWVGVENTPNRPLAYILAGAVIFWLGSARLPSIFAYSTVKLKGLVSIAGLELFGKITLTFFLFSYFDYLSPLIAISLVHLCGVAWGYRQLIKI